MRFRKLPSALAAVALLVAAGCGSGGSGDEGAEDGPTQPSEATEAPELDEGVAAVVGGEELSVAAVDEHVESLSENPQVAEQLESDQADAVRNQLRAQVLSSMILTEVATVGAEDLDNPVTDDDVAAARTEIEQQLGGADALEGAMEQQGLTESLLELELNGLAALRNIQAALDEEIGDSGDDESTPPAPEGSTPGQPQLSPSEQRAQEFLGRRLAETEIAVDPRIGRWDAQTGQVTALAGGVPATPQPGG